MELKDETIRTLKEAFIVDITKEDIRALDRAKLIKQYLIKNKINENEFSKRFNIPKVKVTNWMKPLEKEIKKKEKTKDEMVEILTSRFILDMTKKGVNVLDKAKMLRKYLDNNKLSYNDFARKFNVAKTNVHEWLLPLILPKDKQKEITEKTIMADVYTMLGKDRAKKKKPVILESIDEIKTLESDLSAVEKVSLLRKKATKFEAKKDLNYELNVSIKTFTSFIGKAEDTNENRTLIIALKNVLNEILNKL